MMRTTVTLADDVYEMARELAHKKRISLGEALTELVRQGTEPRAPLRIVNDPIFPHFELPPGARKITTEELLELEAAAEEEEDLRKAGVIG
jgi:hypothetical protein